MPKELKLNNKTEVINVTIGEKTYQVPLATSLPYKKVKTLMGRSPKLPNCFELNISMHRIVLCLDDREHREQY